MVALCHPHGVVVASRALAEEGIKDDSRPCFLGDVHRSQSRTVKTVSQGSDNRAFRPNNQVQRLSHCGTIAHCYGAINTSRGLCGSIGHRNRQIRLHKAHFQLGTAFAVGHIVECQRHQSQGANRNGVQRFEPRLFIFAGKQQLHGQTHRQNHNKPHSIDAGKRCPCSEKVCRVGVPDGKPSETGGLHASQELKNAPKRRQQHNELESARNRKSSRQPRYGADKKRQDARQKHNGGNRQNRRKLPVIVQRAVAPAQTNGEKSKPPQPTDAKPLFFRFRSHGHQKQHSQRHEQKPVGCCNGERNTAQSPGKSCRCQAQCNSCPARRYSFNKAHAAVSFGCASFSSTRVADTRRSTKNR